MRCIICLLLACASLSRLVVTLDVSWIPTDPDGPLPLSAKYRDSLRKLCGLMRSGNPLPAELTNRKRSLTKMCRKLDSGDDNIASVYQGLSRFNFSSIRKVLIAGFVGLGCKFLIWDRRREIEKLLKNLLKKVRNSRTDNATRTLRNVNEARDARLRRFERERSEADADKAAEM